MEIKIYYEDTDCGNVVYYANYLKYFERARTEYMNQRGIDLKDYHERGFFFVVASARVDYRSPARYGETIIVDAVISEVSRVSFTFQYKIREKTSRRLIVEGETRIVLVSASGGKMTPRRLDEVLQTKLK